MLFKVRELEDIRCDLEDISGLWVVVFGSYVKQRSIRDIDIAVITKIKDRDENMRIWYDLIGRFPPIYDIKIFELMPLKIKASIMNDYKVIYGNIADISEYFYFYRKLWNDNKRRIEENRFKSCAEKVSAIQRWKNVKSRIIGRN